MEPNDSCSVEGCGRPEHARGWCNAHYTRWRLTGDIHANEPVRSYTGRKVRHSDPPPQAPPTKRCAVCGAWIYRSKWNARSCSSECAEFWRIQPVRRIVDPETYQKHRMAVADWQKAAGVSTDYLTKPPNRRWVKSPVVIEALHRIIEKRERVGVLPTAEIKDLLKARELRDTEISRPKVGWDIRHANKIVNTTIGRLLSLMENEPLSVQNIGELYDGPLSRDDIDRALEVVQELALKWPQGTDS